MAEQKLLSKLNVLARAFQREDVQPLDLVAVVVLAVKTAPGTRLAYSLCSKVLNACRFLGRGVTCFSGGSDVNETEAKSNRKMSSCCGMNDCSTACWSASREGILEAISLPRGSTYLKLFWSVATAWG